MPGRHNRSLRGEVKPSKFKTSLCNFFAQGAACPFGGRCAFAHGLEELRDEAENVDTAVAALSVELVASARATPPPLPPHGAEISGNSPFLSSTTGAASRRGCKEGGSSCDLSCCSTPRGGATPTALQLPTPTRTFRHNPYSLADSVVIC